MTRKTRAPVAPPPAPSITLTPDEMCVMAVTGITAEQARATYNEIVPIVNALATPVPTGGGLVTVAALNVRAGRARMPPLWASWPGYRSSRFGGRRRAVNGCACASRAGGWLRSTSRYHDSARAGWYCAAGGLTDRRPALCERST